MDLPVTTAARQPGISPPKAAASARSTGAPAEGEARSAFAGLLAAELSGAQPEAALQPGAAPSAAKERGLGSETDESTLLPAAAVDPAAVLLLAAFAPVPIAVTAAATAAPAVGEALGEKTMQAFGPAGERRGRTAMPDLLTEAAGVKTGAAILAETAVPLRELAEAALDSTEHTAGAPPLGAHGPLVDAGPAANAAARAPATAELHTRVNVPGWDVELGKTLVWMAEGKHGVAALKLNPPALGPLEIVIALGGDDGRDARVTFVSPHAAVRDAIENAMPRLREMLAESGISLGQTSVNSQSSHRPGHSDFFRSEGAPAGGLDGTRAEALPAVAVPAVRTGLGIVDTFA